MFAKHCPCCDFDNAAGAKFCAACGVPLHLKPCPQCDRVHELSAEVCEGCGAPFPPLESLSLQLPGSSEVTPNKANTGGEGGFESTLVRRSHRPFGSGASSAGNRAWPLVLVALVAGGLPLLWFNRTHLPVPMAWRLGDSNAASIGQAATPQGQASSVAVVAALPAQLGTDPVPVAKGSLAEAKTRAATYDRPAQKRVHPLQPSRPKPAPDRVDAQAAGGSERDAVTPLRDCTEAMNALGLCTEGQAPVPKQE